MVFWLDRVSLRATARNKQFYAKREGYYDPWTIVVNDFKTPGDELIPGEPFEVSAYLRDSGSLLGTAKMGLSIGKQDAFWLSSADIGTTTDYATFTDETHEGLRIRATWANLTVPDNPLAVDLWVSAKTATLVQLDEKKFLDVLRYTTVAAPPDEVPDEEIPPEVPPEEVPEEVPEVPLSIWESFTKALIDLGLIPVKLNKALFDSAYYVMYGTMPTEEAIKNIQARAADWIPGFALVAKSLFNTDPKTGKAADYKDITGDEIATYAIEIGTGAITAGVLTSLGRKLAMTKGAKTVADIYGNLISAESAAIGAGATKVAYRKSIGGFASGAVRGLLESAKKNPIIAFFAVFEIPQIFLMLGFARHQIMEEQGLIPTGVSITASRYEKTLENLRYDLIEARKTGNTDWIADILETMERTRLGYLQFIGSKKDVLEAAGFYEAMETVAEYYKAVIEENTPRPRIAILPSFTAEIREVIDGDSVRVTWNGQTVDLRLVGINAPEMAHSKENKYTGRRESRAAEIGSKESKLWLASEIWGDKVTITTDPDIPLDKYGRILGTITDAKGNVNLRSVKEGWSMYYPLEANITVEPADYLLAEKTAQDEFKGVWKLRILAKDKLVIPEDEPKKPTMSMIKGQFMRGIIDENEARIELGALGYEEANRNDILADWTAQIKPPKAPPDEVVPPEEVPEAQRIGTIAVRANKRNANIYIDGIFTYVLTPETITEVPLGTHIIKVEFIGYVTQEKEVTLTTPGQKIEIYFVLEETA